MNRLRPILLGPILIGPILSGAALLLAPLSCWCAGTGNPIEGRWDLTITTKTETYPSWMEVQTGGGKAEGTSVQTAVQVVGRVASVHPGEGVHLDGSHLRFTTREYFGKTMNVTWDMTVSGNKLNGTQTREDGTVGILTGAAAPLMKRAAVKAWSKPEPIFNGKDLTGWEPLITEPGKPVQSHWKAVDGALLNESAGANIRTARKFGDFKLHIEYNCPPDGNSGVYLRGRYEVQVEYEAPGKNDKFHGMGAIYGFLAPAKEVPGKPGEWESYDITLVGRTVTIVRDGITTIDRQEIPGITGGALDSNEGEPGPIYLQGDHTGGMKYRNITISVPKE